jgi:methylated-DNA-[protein]-cysteine S-methyltransferase
MSSDLGKHRPETHRFHLPVESAFGTLYVVWRYAAGHPLVLHIALPNEASGGRPGAAVAHLTTTAGEPSPAIGHLAAGLRRYLNGEQVAFDLRLMALETCSEFQRAVLLAECAIPRGAVSTYGRVARAVGRAGAARAVGQALARNPFPIVIPCHRAVRADGELGGYRGGVAMKRALLELEGVSFDSRGRARVDRFHY